MESEGARGGCEVRVQITAFHHLSPAVSIFRSATNLWGSLDRVCVCVGSKQADGGADERGREREMRGWSVREPERDAEK